MVSFKSCGFHQGVNLKMGTEALPSSSMFFRIMLPGFTKRLLLPRKFAKSDLMEETSRTAFLVNPNNESWHVSVHRDDGDMYIGGRGWLDLVHSHYLGLGYLLIFQYEGNSVFRIRVFDLSTCEIAYPSTAKKTKQTPVSVKVEDEEDDEDEHACTTASSKASAKKGPPRIHAYEGRFELKLSAYNLLRGLVVIPFRFRKCIGLRPEQQEVTLKDPKGRLWTVGIWRRKGPNPNRASDVALRRDWKMFARANNLTVGDRCAFELEHPYEKGHEMVWQVKILENHA